MNNEFEINNEFKIPDEYEPFFDDCVMAIPNSNDTIEIQSKECIKLKSKYISSMSFYKYYSTKEHNIEAFENDELYLSRAQDFNDPFDCYFDININNINNIKDFLSAIKDSRTTIKDFRSTFSKIDKNTSVCILQQIKEIILDKTTEHKFEVIKESIFKIVREIFFAKMGVACLSTDGESPLMWAHYAENSKGFCVEYKFDKNFQNSNYARADVSLMPVIYSVEPFYKKFNFLDAIKQEKRNEFLYENLLCKGEDWKIEKEWRIIHNVFGCDETRKRKIKMPFPKAIYLGINMDQLLKEKLINAVIDKNKKNSNEKPIEVYQCHLTPSSGFKFRYDKIDLSNLNSLFE